MQTVRRDARLRRKSPEGTRSYRASCASWIARTDVRNVSLHLVASCQDGVCASRVLRRNRGRVKCAALTMSVLLQTEWLLPAGKTTKLYCVRAFSGGSDCSTRPVSCSLLFLPAFVCTYYAKWGKDIIEEARSGLRHFPDAA